MFTLETFMKVLVVLFAMVYLLEGAETEKNTNANNEDSQLTGKEKLRLSFRCQEIK